MFPGKEDEFLPPPGPVLQDSTDVGELVGKATHDDDDILHKFPSAVDSGHEKLHAVKEKLLINTANACFQSQSPQDQIGKDLFESLPDCLLIEIVSMLPTLNEAARTSSISRRCRYLWKHIHTLNLEVAGDSCLYSPILPTLQIDKLKTLRIKFQKPYESYSDEIKKLVDYGIKKGVENLCLLKGHKIPHNIFSITTLTKLELRLCEDRLPSFINLPRVHTLVLAGMRLDKTNLRCLMSNAPALESLFIDSWMDIDRIEISGSATLKRLKMRCRSNRTPSDGVDIVDLPSLETLELQGPVPCLGILSTFSNLPSLRNVSLCLYFDEYDKDLEYGVWSIMNRLPQVKYLRLHILFPFVLDHEEASGRLQCMNITRLELNSSIAVPVHIEFMCHLLSSSPHLEILKILDYEMYYCAPGRSESECWNHIEYSFSSLLPQLREVIIHLSLVGPRDSTSHSGWWDARLKLIRILLSKSRTLEKLTIVPVLSYGSSKISKSHLTSKLQHILQGYDKASPSIEILLCKEILVNFN